LPVLPVEWWRFRAAFPSPSLRNRRSLRGRSHPTK
jgi:hypothetical protein